MTAGSAFYDNRRGLAVEAASVIWLAGKRHTGLGIRACFLPNGKRSTMIGSSQI
jgi:hypothetical protein